MKTTSKITRPTRNYRRNHQTYRTNRYTGHRNIQRRIRKSSWQQSKSRKNSFWQPSKYINEKRDTDPVLFKKTIRTH